MGSPEKVNIATTSKMETILLHEMKDGFIGERGTDVRENYEYELNMEVLVNMNKAARKEVGLNKKN